MKNFSSQALGAFLQGYGKLQVMADYAAGWKHIAMAEGGFCNVPGDAGGATNLGITMATLARWRGRAVSVQDVKNLTKAEAAKIYKAYYWDPCDLDDVKNDQVATLIFDQAVNRGLGYISAVQRIVNVKADGHIGDATIKAINAEDPKHLIDALCDEAKQKYMGIVQANPKQRKFLAGWLSRVDHLRELKALA